MKKILVRGAIILLALLVFLSVLLIVFTQFKPFRGWFADAALSFVNNSLEAEITVSDLYLNPFSGVEVWDATMVVDGDTLAYVKKITLDADFFDLLDGRITVSSLVLDNPRILLQKKKGSEKWNFELIAKPSPEKPPSPLPELVFDIRRLAINDGTVRCLDQNQTSVPGKINFTDIDARSFNLELGAFADLKNLDFNVDISKIAFEEKQSGLVLKDLDIGIGVNKKGIDLSKCALKTANSDLAFSLKADNVDIFEPITKYTFAPGYFGFKLYAGTVSPKDIRLFTDFAAGNSQDIMIDIAARGTVGEFILERFKLKNGGTNLNFRGTAYNLGIAELAGYNVEFEKSDIELADLSNFIPPSVFESIPSVEFVSIESLNAGFRNNTIQADFDVRTGSGSVTGTGTLDLDKEKYDLEASTTNLNLAGITGTKSLGSSLNADIKVTGKSFDPARMDTKIDVKSRQSKYSTYNYNNLVVKGRISGGILYADTLLLLLPDRQKNETEPDGSQAVSVNFNGILDIRNRKEPYYKGKLAFSSINLKDILNAPDAPKRIGGEINVEGRGFDPDRMNGELTADIYELEFGDKSFMPFTVAVKAFSDGNQRKLDITSSFMNLSVEGDYSYDKLISLIETQSSYLTGYIGKKLRDVDFNRASDTLLPESVYNLGRFDPFRLKIKGTINDLSPVAIFLDSTKLTLKAKIDISVSVTEKQSSVNIDSLVVYSFFYESPGTMVAVRPTQINSALVMSIADSVLSLSHLDLSVKSQFPVTYNDLQIVKPDVDLSIADDIINFSVSGGYGNDISGVVRGSVELKNKNIGINLSSLSADYKNSISIHNVKPVVADISSSGFNVRQFELQRGANETISLSGKFNDDVADNVKLSIANLPFNGYNSLLPASVAEGLKKIQGKIESLDIEIGDSLKNPDIKLHLKTDQLLADRIPVGAIDLFLRHKNSVVKGNLSLVTTKDNEYKKYLSVDINSFPINLALKDVKDRIHEQMPLNVSVYTDELPLNLLSPFLAGTVESLKGSLNLEVNINGNIGKPLNYSGRVLTRNASFHLIPTNMSFFADTDIELKDGEVIVNNIELRNTASDFARGRLNLNGKVQLKDYDLRSIDVSLRSKGFKVLSRASSASIPSIYGDVIISTGPSNIKFVSDMSNSTLKGNINIEQARLFMPNKKTTQSTISKIKYEFAGNKTAVSLLDTMKAAARQQKDSAAAKNGNGKNGSFYKGMAIDLDVNILKPIYMDMDLFSLFFTQKLTAEIGTIDKTMGLKFSKDRNTEDAMVYGELELKKGSKLSFIKVFNTEGFITFPTGNMGNPALNLKAEYSGVTEINNNQRNYVVILKITGTKDKPMIDFDYKIDDEEATGDTSQIREDAIFLLLSGRTKAELFSSGGAQANIVSDLGNTGLSTAVSTALSQILAGTIIKSADIELSESWEETKLKLSGQLVGYVGWKFGGNVADLMGNNEITIELPLDFLLNNAMIQFTWTTNPETIITKDQKKGEIKVKIIGSY